MAGNHDLQRHVLFSAGLALAFLAAACDAPLTQPPDSEAELAPSSGLAASQTAGAPGSGEARTYDLQADWSDTDNPNGVWSVNAGDTPLAHVADLSTTGIDAWNFPQPGFTAKPIFDDITPVWFQADGPLDNGNPDWAVGDVVTHTSRSFVPNSNVTWTSEVGAVVDISGNVWATREFGRTNDWFLYLNDQLLTSGTVAGGDPYDRDNPFPLEGGSGGAAPLDDVAVSAGDVLKLEFQQKFGFGEDYVGVNFTVTLVAPRTKDDCKQGGWELFGFGNQGLCVRFVETGKDSR